MLKDKRNWVFFGLISLYAIYIGYRAYTIPITHDEASSWLNLRELNLWTCLTNSYCWSTANNHWLNTLLFQFSCSLIGESPLAMRLPNVLAGIGYGIIAFLFVKKFITGSWTQLAGWLLLCIHFYMIEFFGYARGYGLMTFFILLSVYQLCLYADRPGWKILTATLLSFGLAIASNFTSLIPVCGLGIAWFGWVVISRRYSLIWKHGIFFLCFLIILAIVLSFPIKSLYENGEFKYGVKLWWEMARDFFWQASDFQVYFSKSTPVVLFSIYCVVLVTSILYIIKNWKIKRDSVFMLTVLMSITTPLLIWVYLNTLNGAAPVGRKSIFFFPILLVGPVMALNYFKNVKFKFIVSLVVVLFTINHIIRVLPVQLNESRDWFFDSYTYILFREIKHTDKPTRIGCSWLMQPGLEYYKVVQHFPIEGLAYEKTIQIDTSMDYYYVLPEDSTGMAQHNFKLVKSIGSNFLFQNQK